MHRISMNMTQKARELRSNMTDAELLLWYKIRRRQLYDFRFRRQYVMERYIVDFICLEAHLIIELDGSQHMEQVADDNERDCYLAEQGYKVLRFWNNELLHDMDAVLLVIGQHLLVE